MPTETVYGLAANALDPAAVAEIFAVKGRPADNPLIVHIARLSMWEPLVEKLTEPALRLAKAFWPAR
jgi:L-threonylcarbamoyladenylate synthase